MKSNKKIDKACRTCKKDFIVPSNQPNKKFCSRQCFYNRTIQKGKNSPQYKKITIKCDYCNKNYDEFPNKLKKINNHFCTRECYNKYQTNKAKVTTTFIIKYCAICNNEVKRTKAEFKNRPSKNYYCSIKCRDISKRTIHGGFKPLTKECKYCNKKFTITSKNKRTVKYCSIECRQESYKSGEEHHLFKKELSRDYRSRHRLFPEVAIWRKTIFERDQYICQLCNKKGDKLNAHHFENYSSNKEKRFNIDNGVTLCVKCHKQFHSKYGVVRNNKKQFEEFKSSYVVQ